MTDQPQRHRRWVLASRPHGEPTAENFRLEESEVPTPGPGQVLLRTVYLSLDPYMRGRMSDAPSYSPPVAIGAVMVGGTVSRVVSSNHADYQPGDWVLGYSGWQDYELSDGSGLVKLGDNPQHPSWSLGVLGMPGFTAYMGLLDIGQPKAGETLVVDTDRMTAYVEDADGMILRNALPYLEELNCQAQKRMERLTSEMAANPGKEQMEVSGNGTENDTE